MGIISETVILQLRNPYYYLFYFEKDQFTFNKWYILNYEEGRCNDE